MNNVIEFKNINKSYKNFEMKDVTFSVPKGYITGFIGPNGSGKTTSIKMLLSAVYKDSGGINMFSKPSELVNAEDVGYVLADNFLVKEWLISDIKKLMPNFYTRWNAESFELHLKQFNIEDTYRVKELSSGMTVKLLIAIALSHGAKLLVLDEPTSGLDPAAREEICDILQQYVEDEENSVFFSTHITSDLNDIADFIIFILDGKIIYEGEKEYLIESYTLVKGGLDDLETIDTSNFIGIRKQSTHFEALCKSNTGKIDGLLYEPITLDDLIKFYIREAKYEKDN